MDGKLTGTPKPMAANQVCFNIYFVHITVQYIEYKMYENKNY